MDQTTKIAGAIIVAFVVWVILRGEVPAYQAIFLPKKKS